MQSVLQNTLDQSSRSIEWDIDGVDYEILVATWVGRAGSNAAGGSYIQSS